MRAIWESKLRQKRHLSGMAPQITGPRVFVHRLVQLTTQKSTPRMASTLWAESIGHQRVSSHMGRDQLVMQKRFHVMTFSCAPPCCQPNLKGIIMLFLKKINVTKTCNQTIPDLYLHFKFTFARVEIALFQFLLKEKANVFLLFCLWKK